MAKRSYNQWNKYCQEKYGKWQFQMEHDERFVEHKKTKSSTPNAERTSQSTDYYVTFKGEPEQYAYTLRNTTTQSKFLCIGGPLDGTRATFSQAKGYTEFNNAGKRRDGHSVVRIHDSLLKGK